MAAINLQAYKVVTQELSSATKFNNLVQAIQDAFTAVGTTDISVGGTISAGTSLVSNNYAFYAYATGDTQPRVLMRNQGPIEWGPGNAATDTNLYRASANALKTDDSFTAVGTVNSYDDVWAQLGAAAEMHMGARGPAGEAGLLFGQGASADTNLYRASANILRTDDAFVAEFLKVSTSVACSNETGGMVMISTAGATPNTPTGGGVLYVDAGALKYRGTSGTITLVAPA